MLCVYELVQDGTYICESLTYGKFVETVILNVRQLVTREWRRRMYRRHWHRIVCSNENNWREVLTKILLGMWRSEEREKREEREVIRMLRSEERRAKSEGNISERSSRWDSRLDRPTPKKSIKRKLSRTKRHSSMQVTYYYLHIL